MDLKDLTAEMHRFVEAKGWYPPHTSPSPRQIGASPRSDPSGPWGALGRRKQKSAARRSGKPTELAPLTISARPAGQGGASRRERNSPGEHAGIIRRSGGDVKGRESLSRHPKSRGLRMSGEGPFLRPHPRHPPAGR